MKIRSVGSQVGKIPSVGPASTSKAQGARRAQAASSRAAAGSEPIGDIAARYHAGEITRHQAVSLVVDVTVAKLQGASPSLRRKIRSALTKVAGEDPALLTLLDGAGKRR